MTEILAPIPCLEEARAIKTSYREHVIDESHPVFAEPLVPLSEYDVTGINYYSQPNSATGDPVPGVTPNVFVRRSVAEKLAAANEYIRNHDEIALEFGSRIELYVRDGFRSPVLQEFLATNVIPSLLRAQQPQWTEEQVQARLKQVISSPEWSEKSMPPHFTGGAVDLSLREVDSQALIDVGHGGKAELSMPAIHTDYLETMAGAGLSLNGLEKALNARRVLYNVMLSEEIGGVSMQNNPTETWHYSMFDQMWATLGGHPAAFYGIPPEIPDELCIASIEEACLVGERGLEPPRAEAH